MQASDGTSHVALCSIDSPTLSSNSMVATKIRHFLSSTALLRCGFHGWFVDHIPNK